MILCPECNLYYCLFVSLADNRTALRELEGLEKLIDFVGNKEFDDLHVHALQVLTNCMQDPESMQVRISSFILKETKVLLPLERQVFTNHRSRTGINKFVFTVSDSGNC